MPIYDKPTRELMREFAAERLKPGQVFTHTDAVRWFAENYPKINKSTVYIHVRAMSVNDHERRHQPRIRPGGGWDLFFKPNRSDFRLWNPETDPAPRYQVDFQEEIEDGDDGTDDPAEEDTAEDDPGSRKFAMERDLQGYLAKNLGLLESGLKLYEDQDGAFTGVEFPAGQRRIDILAVGADGAYVVIETKVSRAYDRVVGQVLRYMGWIEENLAGDDRVRGIVVASEISEDLILATSSIENIRLVEYEISFELKPVQTSK